MELADHDLLTRLDEKVHVLQSKTARLEKAIDDHFRSGSNKLTRNQTVSLTTTISAAGAILIKLFWN